MAPKPLKRRQVHFADDENSGELAEGADSGEATSEERRLRPAMRRRRPGRFTDYVMS